MVSCLGGVNGRNGWLFNRGLNSIVLKLRGLKLPNANLKDWNEMRWNVESNFCIPLPPPPKKRKKKERKKEGPKLKFNKCTTKHTPKPKPKPLNHKNRERT